jgi:hypothetical protein
LSWCAQHKVGFSAHWWKGCHGGVCTYDLLSFEEEVDPDEGILVHVRRVSDKKTFLLSLANLEATQKKSPQYQLLDDYAVWFVNWR